MENKKMRLYTPEEMQQMTLDGERSGDPTPQQKLSDEEFMNIFGKVYIKSTTGKAMI